MKGSFKGVLKYLIYIFIAVWMFVLGIVVGRGTSPVTFDTQKFQERLETIAKASGADKEKPGPKVSLKIYGGGLENPIPVEGQPEPKTEAPVAAAKKVPAPAPEKKTMIQGDIPFKTALKSKTRNKKKLAQIKPGAPDSKPAPRKTAPSRPARPTKPSVPETEKGKFTLQVAAYKDFRDAVTQMAQLEKKGYTAYRVKHDINGQTWYRVRIGSFETYDQARSFKAKLKKDKIDSMITNK